MYDGLSAVNIHRALSLVPAEVTGFFDLDTAHYLPDAVLRDYGNEYRALTHAQIEFLAARVSAINQMLLLNHQPCGAAPWERPAYR